MTRENSGVAQAKFRNTASYKIKWRQDHIELKYLRKKTPYFWVAYDYGEIIITDLQPCQYYIVYLVVQKLTTSE